MENNDVGMEEVMKERENFGGERSQGSTFNGASRGGTRPQQPEENVSAWWAAVRRPGCD